MEFTEAAGKKVLRPSADDAEVITDRLADSPLDLSNVRVEGTDLSNAVFAEATARRVDFSPL